MAEKAYCGICNRNFKDEAGLAAHSSAKHSASESNGKSKGSSSKWLIFLIVGFLVVAGFVMFSGRISGTGTGNVVSSAGEFQKINIGFKDYNYYPRTITVKLNVPVEITLDSSVNGCFRSFNIRDLGISKSSSSPSDKITFTPAKKGTFEFACGMHMGTGTIVVE